MKLTVENLSVRKGEDLLFMNISLMLTSGESLLLTGKNGTGKSTLLRTIAGLLPPETGTITLSGLGVDSEVRASEACHYLGHRNAMKADLTVFENLTFWKSFLGNFIGGNSITIEEAAEIVRLTAITHLPYGYLSAGQQRRFAMAKVLISWRPIWLLDEPTAALDKESEKLFAEIMQKHLDKGGMIIAATHQPLGFECTNTIEMKGFY